jgi:hypothetical protein
MIVSRGVFLVFIPSINATFVKRCVPSGSLQTRFPGTPSALVDIAVHESNVDDLVDVTYEATESFTTTAKAEVVA